MYPNGRRGVAIWTNRPSPLSSPSRFPRHPIWGPPPCQRRQRSFLRDTFAVLHDPQFLADAEKAPSQHQYFAWPPLGDSDRPPNRGMRPLEAEDAAIFFGRDGPITRRSTDCAACERLRRPRLLVILGASGAGKSSFPRAGLFPWLNRDDRTGARLAMSSRVRFVGGPRRELHGLPTN